MGELLDFVARDNFEFFKMSFAGREQKEELQGDCERVLHYAHATVKDMCLLATYLHELKEKEQWQKVINPETGLAFWNYNFDDFCAYAFGFSKTKTSNLLRISQFVNLHGEKRGEIEASYADYNTSQLVELAAVPPSYRVYFSSDMSVSDMRVAKYYIKMGPFYEEKKKVGFDLLTKAQEWKESEQKQTPVPARSPEVMDGQLSIFSEENEEENERGEASPNPTSDLTQVCEASEVDEYDEADEAQEDMRADMQTIEEAAEMSFVPTVEPDLEESPLPRYDLSKRKEIREFLHGYKTWIKRWEIYGLLTVYVCRFRNGMRLYAVENKRLLEMEGGEPSVVVRYYWKTEQGATAYEVSTNILWEYIAAHNEEL